jgi:hypothetical protein
MFALQEFRTRSRRAAENKDNGVGGWPVATDSTEPQGLNNIWQRP